MNLNHVKQLMRLLYWGTWERDEPHSYRYSPEPRWRTTPPSWEQQRWWRWRWRWQRCRWRSLPGALPRSGSVPEQRLLSPRSWLRDGGGSGRFSVSWFFVLGVSSRGLFVGGRVGQEAARGPHTTGPRGQGGGPRRPMVWPLRGPSSSLLRTSGSFVEK